MQTIGFIGLGLMGKPMAQHLLRASYSLIVHNRSQNAVNELVAQGARAAPSPAELAAQSDILITMLPDPPTVVQVIAGENGIFQSAHDGLLLIDMTSNDPALARQIAQRAQTLGIEMLDAPVSGGAIGAQQATLTIMVGGTREGFDRAVPILSHLATTVVHVGAAGAGQITKAVNQMLVGITIAAVSEGIVLLEKAGVDVDAARRAMLNGFAASRVLDYHGARMIQRDFQPGGRARLHLKDLNIALTLADQYHVSTPTTQIVRDLFQTLVNQGDGDLDHSALIKVIQRASTP